MYLPLLRNLRVSRSARCPARSSIRSLFPSENLVSPRTLSPALSSDTSPCNPRHAHSLYHASLRGRHHALDSSSHGTRPGLPRQYFSSASSDSVGLYGFPELKTAEGFGTMFHSAKVDIESLVRQMSDMTTAMNVIHAMDEISNRISIVGDAAECCRNTHTDPKFVAEAEKVHIQLLGLVAQLNANCSIYDKLKWAVETLAPHRNDPEVEEAYRVGASLKLDCELGGVHLDDFSKAKVEKLFRNITEAEVAFGQNLAGRNLNWFQVPPDRVRSLQGLPSNLRGLVSVDQGNYKVHVSKPMSAWMLSSFDDEEMRKRAFLASASWPAANLEHLEALMENRFLLAQATGLESYAHSKTRFLLSQHPEPVVQFLHDLSAAIRPSADLELAHLQEVKRRHLQLAPGSQPAIRGWDEHRYMTLARPPDAKDDGVAVREYLSMGNVMQGLSLVAERLYSCSLRQVAMPPGESWVQGDTVTKYEVTHEDQGLLGHVYLDLFRRAGKFPHAAHFTIRCGRQTPQGGGRQTPLVALVCNFAGFGSPGAAALSFKELEVLFHEFGHAMHSVLSLTRFQQLSGNRAALDFVEVPSTLMEYFAKDPRVLQLFARHPHTGQPVPAELVARLVRAENLFQGLDTQVQVVQALADQAFHSARPPLQGQSTAAVAEIRGAHSAIPHEEGTAPHLQLGHVINYPASYYAYLYSRSIAAVTWQELFEADPLDPAAGREWNMKVLRHGGTRHPHEMYKELLPSTAVFRQTGADLQWGAGEVGYFPDTTPLMDEMARAQHFARTHLS